MERVREMRTQTLRVKSYSDLVLVTILSALLVVVIAYFPDSSVRSPFGLPFILFFPGYMLICALFPRNKDWEIVERLALCLALSVAITPLIGLALNYTVFGITLYSVTFSLFLFILLMSAVAVYRRRTISAEEAFAPLSPMSISRCFERVKENFIKSDDTNRLIKIISIIAFIFITLTLIVITNTPPASGYELSIYYAYPWYFWVFICISINSGILILLHQAFSEQKSNWWLMGLCIVILSDAIFLGLPFFRGYFIFPKGDALTHLGMMKDILITGSIGNYNFYPTVHLLGVSLLDITGLSRGAVTNLLFGFWTIIYLLNMYLLSTVVANYRGQALLITAFACPLVFSHIHVLIHPALLSLFMIPLLLYFYHKSEKSQSTRLECAVVLILLTFSIAFTHPVTCLFVIMVLLTFNLSKLLYPQIVNRKEFALESSVSTSRNYNIPLIMLAVFFMWYFSYAYITGSFKKVHDFLVYGGRMSVYEGHISRLAWSGVTTSQTIELFIYRYGAMCIYLIIAGISVAILLRASLSRNTPQGSINFTYSILFIVALATSAFSLWGFTGEGEPWRIIRFTLLMVPIVSGLAIYGLVRGDRQHQHKLKQKQKEIISITIILILAVSVLSIFNVYGSPRIITANWQVSKMEIDGTEWFGNHQDGDIHMAYMGSKVKRFVHLNFGVQTCPPAKRVRPHPSIIPSHFGYDGNSTIAETFNYEDWYLLSCEAGRINIQLTPKNIQSKAHQYTEADFAKLSADSAVAPIYANGEFEVWLVYGK